MKISKYETQIYRYISVVTFDLLGPGQSQRMKVQLQQIPGKLEKGLTPTPAPSPSQLLTKLPKA